MRLFDADAIEKEIQDDIEEGGMSGVVGGALRRYLRRQPTVDAVPVVHGKWLPYVRYTFNEKDEMVGPPKKILVCSECEREARCWEPYCHCGAKMDGEADV